MRTLAGKTTKFGKLLLEAARADTTGRGGLAVLGAAAAVAAAADDSGELIKDGKRQGKAAGNVRAPETKQRAKRARPG